MDSGRLRILLLIVSLALAPIACAEDAAPEPAGEGTETSASAAAEALEQTSLKPEIPKPAGSPPRNLETEDIVKGKGPAAKPGDEVVVQHVGVNFSTGEEFDASWTTDEPFTFRLGGRRVIEGWNKGIAGMRKGGRRMLTIPPRLGYGAEGSPPEVGPNETLVVVIDLVRIR